MVVLWLCCDCAVVVLWLCCGCAVSFAESPPKTPQTPPAPQDGPRRAASQPRRAGHSDVLAVDLRHLEEFSTLLHCRQV